MRDFLKYLAWGSVALLLSLSFPQWRVDWLAIVLAQAFIRSQRQASAWLLLLALGLAYSAFSLASPAAIVLPLTLSPLVYLALRRNFSLTPSLGRFFLLVGFWTGPFLFWSLRSAWMGAGWYPGWGDALGFALTLGLGMSLPTFLARLWARAWGRFRLLGGSARGVDLSRADWLSGRGARILRKPFGLEKGL